MKTKLKTKLKTKNLVDNKVVQDNIVKSDKSLTKQEAFKLEYPYYSLYYDFNLKKIKNIIKKFKPIILYDLPIDYYGEKLDTFKFDSINQSSKNNKYFLIKENWKKYEELNSLTDYFSEFVRVKCIFGSYLSPFEFWSKNKKFIINLTLKKYNLISIPNLRDTIYYNNKLCNNFRISIVITVLNSFKHERYLDISAGWGDRLLGAIFSGVKRYVSADPNLALQSCYNNIKNTFLNKKQSENFIIYPMSFLNIPLENEEPFDIVFSSPPFFTLEKYSMFDMNSITNFMDEKIWINNFFVKSLVKCYNHLKKDGIMILYMGGSQKVFDNMFRLNQIMNYLGKIYYVDELEEINGSGSYLAYKNIRKMFVWKKINNDTITDLPKIIHKNKK